MLWPDGTEVNPGLTDLRWEWDRRAGEWRVLGRPSAEGKAMKLAEAEAKYLREIWAKREEERAGAEGGHDAGQA